MIYGLSLRVHVCVPDYLPVLLVVEHIFIPCTGTGTGTE